MERWGYFLGLEKVVTFSFEAEEVRHWHIESADICMGGVEEACVSEFGGFVEEKWAWFSINIFLLTFGSCLHHSTDWSLIQISKSFLQRSEFASINSKQLRSRVLKLFGDHRYLNCSVFVVLCDRKSLIRKLKNLIIILVRIIKFQLYLWESRSFWG